MMRRVFSVAALGVFAVAVAASPGTALVITLDPEELASPMGEASGGTAHPEAPPSPPGLPAAPSDEALATSAGPVTARAAASKTEVSLGERFVVEVSTQAPPGTTFTFPAEVVTEGVELRSVTPAPGAASPAPAAPVVHRYEAALFELQDAKVPPVVVRYRMPDGTEGETATEPLAVRVTSRLPKDADPGKIADIRGPVALGVGQAFWIALAVLVAGLVALVAWLIRRRRPEAEAAPAVVPPVDPAAEARAALQALVGSGLLARGDHRGFYIALTTIAKRYLERRLAAPVLEMTTAEMVAFLRDAPLAGRLVTPIRDLANAADQIKFARGAGLQAEAERHTEAVRDAIRTIEEALAPRPSSTEQEKVA
jgi:hypothetical protein